jgi:hypothetical protein
VLERELTQKEEEHLTAVDGETVVYGLNELVDQNFGPRLA